VKLNACLDKSQAGILEDYLKTLDVIQVHGELVQVSASGVDRVGFVLLDGIVKICLQLERVYLVRKNQT
jgi:hypothetical protein